MTCSPFSPLSGGDTLVVVTLVKSSVTPTCHRGKILSFSFLHFTVTLVTGNVCELVYAKRKYVKCVYMHFSCVLCIYKGNKIGCVTCHVSRPGNRKGGAA